MGFIYKITNLKNNKVYIGQTINSISYRWKQHICRSKDKKYNFTLYLAIRKYGLENFKIEEIENCPNSQLDAQERKWIEYYDSYNNGYNMTPGGDGQISDIKINLIHQKWIEGKSISEIADELGYHRATVRRKLQNFNDYSLEQANLRGKQRSIKAKQKTVYIYTMEELYNVFDTTELAAQYFNVNIRTIRKNCHEQKYVNYYFFSYEPLTLEQRFNIIKKQNKMPVLQYDLDGNLIHLYGCIAEAQYKTKINNISKAIKNEKSAGNFQWRCSEKIVDKITSYIPKANVRKVKQYSLNGEYIKTFNSLSDAAREIGAVNSSGISIACQNFQKTAKGFKWQYE